MNIQLVVVDMDGTLLNSKDELTHRTIKAFNKLTEMGIVAVVATGRNYREAILHAQAIGAGRILISDNGAMVADYDKDIIILESYLNPKLVKFVMEITGKHPKVFVQYHTRRGCVVNRADHPLMKSAGWSKNHLADYYETQIPVEDVSSYLRNENLPVHKVVMSSSVPKDLDEIAESLSKEKSLSVLRTMIYCLEAIPVEIHKGIALQKLCEYLDIPIEATMAVGDSENDYEMLQVAGFSVAMGNATSAVKSICDAVVSSNDEDGLAEAIEKYIFNNI